MRVEFWVGGEGATAQVGRTCVTRVAEVRPRLGFACFDERHSMCDGAVERAAERRLLLGETTRRPRTVGDGGNARHAATHGMATSVVAATS